MKLPHLFVRQGIFRKFAVRGIALLLILVFFLTPGQNTGVFALFFSTIPDEYDLVAILVEKDIYQLTQNISGIPNAQTPATTLKARVDRFAEDLQNALTKTRAVIMTVEQNEKTENIAHVLERLYFEGDMEEPLKNARLKGVILIGNVPLPVVNKKGTRFISLFPYTDFEKKVYLWNPETGDFDFENSLAVPPQPEVWHGVIRPPVERSDPQYLSLLAKFLDKNHLYKIGNSAYAVFGKNLFYADLFWEKKNINAFSFKRYLNYLKYAEDLAYFRYTKEFFKKLFDEVQAELGEEGLSADSLPPEEQAQLEAAKQQAIASAAASAGVTVTPSGSDDESGLDNLPDVQTKELIEKYLGKFNDLFTKYPALINDFVSYTGRYKPEENLDTFVNLVAAKDKFTFGYLKEANTMIEREIDRIVSENLQKNIPLLEEVTVRITEVKPRDDDDAIPSSADATDLDAYEFNPATFTNFSPEISVDTGAFVPRILGKEMDLSNPAALALKSTGAILSPVISAADCSLFRGSPASVNPATGEERISKLVEGNRIFDPYTGGRSFSQEEFDNDAYDLDEDSPYSYIFENHGGCFYDNLQYPAQNPQYQIYGNPPEDRCFPEAARDPIFSIQGTKKRLSRPVGMDDYRACFNFHEKEQYKTYLDALDWVLEKLDNPDPSDYDPPELEAERRRLLYLTLAGHADPDILGDDDIEDYLGYRVNQIPQTKASNQITLFQNVTEGYSVKLSDLISGIGASNLSFLAKEQDEYSRIHLPNHPDVEWVTFEVDQDKVKDLSSVFYHKEPTPYTLREQNKSQVTSDMPIDNPRYVTFQDKQENRRQIIYPNIFEAPTFEAYLQKLQQAEAQLGELGVAASMSANAFSGRLTSKLSTLPDQSAADPERNNKILAYSRMQRAKVEDALEWRWMDVEEKHRYAIGSYLNPFKNAYIGERTNGYEMTIINATGEHDFFSIDLQPEGEISPDVLESQNQAGDRDTELQQEEPDFGAFGGPPPLVPDPLYLFTFETVSVEDPLTHQQVSTHFPWFISVKKWLDSIGILEPPEEKSIGESGEGFYAALHEDQQAASSALAAESDQEDAQANDSPEKQTSFSRAHSIELSSPFPVLVSGGDSRTSIALRLKDKDGKFIADEAAEVTVEIEGESVVISPDISDLNPKQTGFQTAALGREFAIEVVSTERAGTSQVRVSVEGTDVSSSILIKVFENARIDLSTNVLGTVANGTNEIPFTVRAIDDNGNIISNVSGQVELSVSDAAFGTLDHETVQLNAGSANVKFRVSSKAGRVMVEVRGGGLPPGTIELTTLPGPPSFLRLEKDQEFLNFEPGSTLKLRGVVYDANGNAVTTNNSLQLRFEILAGEESSHLGETGAIRVQGGTAEVSLFPGEKIGKVRVKVRDQGNTLAPALLEVPARIKVKPEDIQQNPPETLVSALLGFDGGNVAKSNFLAGWFAFSGKNQATVSLTTKPKASLSLLSISPSGKVQVFDQSRIAINVLSGPQPRIEFKDTTFQETIAEIVITPKPNTMFVIGASAASSETAEPASTIQFFTVDPAYLASISPDGGKLNLTFEGSKVFEMTKVGAMRLLSTDLSLGLDESGATFGLLLKKGADIIARIIFNQHFDTDVRISGNGPFMPGVTVLPKETLSKVKIEPSFTGNSTGGAKGVTIFDTEHFASGDKAPGFDTLGLEDSLTTQGIGFIDGTKFGQLFAAGNMFGESVLPYASDIGIIIGDPTVRVSNAAPGGYNTDSGSFIHHAPENVRELLSLDYDIDGDDDVFLVFGSGSIQLLENRGGKLGFLDRGIFLNVGNGIASLAKADINNDGRMDLVVAGLDACRRGETCLDVYENKIGYFERKNIQVNLGPEERIQVLKPGDLNNDGRIDIVALDMKGNLRAFYNRLPSSGFLGGLEPNGQLIGNLGLTINPSQNLIQSVLFNYASMPQKDSAAPPITNGQPNPHFVANFQELTWSIPDPNRRSGLSFPGFEEEQTLQEVKRDFIYADLDPRFSASTKVGVDENGGVLENGDVIRYTITIRNSGSSAVNDLKFADVFSSGMILDLVSVRCENCGPSEELRAHDTTNPDRPYYFYGMRIPAGGSRIISYRVTYKAAVPQNSRFIITVGDNLSNQYLVRDQYDDIMVTADDNTTGQARFFYSTGLNAQNRVIYTSMLSAPPENPQPSDAFSAAADYLSKIADAVSGLPSDPDDPDSIPDSAMDLLESRKSGDADDDGIPDTLDDVNGTLDQVNEALQNSISQLRCNAGCIPTPVNAAFLSPGNFSILGTPGPFDPGLPVIAFPTSPLIPVWPITPSYQSSLFRLYLSPTLTGGLGIGLCYGSYLLAAPPAGGCIAFATSALAQATGVCDAIGGTIEGALATANGVIREANEGVALNVGPRGVSTTATANRESGGLANYSLGGYQAPAPRQRNIRIPGFPSVITDWARAQLDEVIDKLLDVPDIYLIYPRDVFSTDIIKNFTPTAELRSFSALLTYLNSIPLLDIETEDVTFKLPLVTRKELMLFKYDAQLWMQDLQAEWEKVKAIWKCATLDEIRDYCNLVEARMSNVITTMNQNIDNVEAWILLPKRILDYRNIEAYLARQIIDYLDTVVQYTGGYLSKQKALMNAWVRAVRNMIVTIRNWQLLLEVFLDYQESCDECKTERFSLKELIIRFFAVIPSPPVIPIPKWPDFVIDISKIQAGLTVRWPALKFKPEPLVLPKLPRIRLPTFPLPQIELIFPDIPVIRGPPSLPELPQLPALKLPKLPDLLPPPPKLPPLLEQFSVVIDILKRIVKLLCILKTGLMPIPEVTLKSQIEAMTARGLNPLLPLDFLVTVQTPTIEVEYVDQVIFTNYLNFGLENQQAVEVARDAARQVNAVSSNIAKQWREYFQNITAELEKYTQPKIPFEENIREFGRGIQIDVGSGKVRTRRPSNYVPKKSPVSLEQTDQLTQIASVWTNSVLPMLNTAQRQYAKAVRETPKQVRVTMADESFTPRADRFDEIRLKKGALPVSPITKEIVQYRDALISYATGIEQQKALLEQGDLVRASRIALQMPKGLKQENRMFAATASSTKSRDAALSGRNAKAGNDLTRFGSFDIEKTLHELEDSNVILRQAQDDRQAHDDEGRLIASSHTGSGSGGAGSGSGSGSGDLPVANIGLYVANPLTGQSQRALAYTGELEFPRKLLFIDYDRDGDKDLIYTTGGDVFMKEFFGGNTQSSYHFSEDYIEHHALSDLIPTYAAINRFANVSESVRDATVTFRKGEKALHGYELRLKDSVKFFDGRGSYATDFVELFTFIDETVPLPEISDGRVDLEKLPLKKAVIVAIETDGGELKGKTRTIVTDDSGEILVNRDEVVHPLGEAEVTFKTGGGEEYSLELQPFHMIPATEFFGANLKIEIESGKVEIIASQNGTSPLLEGMAIEQDDMLRATSETHLELRQEANPSIRTIKNGDTFKWTTIEDPQNPLSKLALDPSHYYGKMLSFNEAGFFGIKGETVLLSPQVCGDTTPPFANVGAGVGTAAAKKFQVPLLKKLVIDASSSYDGQGNVARYAMDVDRLVDSNGDSDPGNDPNIEQTNPVFLLGPFAEIGTRKAKLAVYDEANNAGSVDIDIEVIMPEITLQPESLREGKVEGFIDPRDPNVPITIARKRDGIWQKLETPSADPQGRYLTNINGVFSVTDLDLRDRLIVRNSEGKIVAEINRKLGTVIILDDRYHLEAFPALPPDLPTRVAIVDSRGQVLTFVFLVPDVNTDAMIDPPDVSYNAQAFFSMIGVHVNQLSTQFELRVLAGDSTEAPGAMEILKEGKRAALIDVNGDVIFMAEFENQLQLRMKPATFDEPIVYELYFAGTKVAEIFITSHLPQTDYVEIVDQAEVAPARRPRPRLLPGETPFLDVRKGDPLAPVLNDLYDKGIIQGYQNQQGQLEFRKDQAITRAEFAKITLEMLCIDPRKEAKETPQVFSDVLFKSPLDWFYEWTKEANLQGLIYGYLREPDSRTGLYPFKPGFNITRAEAAKIVLEALDLLNVIDLSKINRNIEPWFKPFIDIAQNISSYVVGEKETAINYVLTPQEGREPVKKITRGEFAEMASRVLKIRNCFTFDSDGDGLKDEWEKKNLGSLAQDGDDDPDRDTLLNAEEEKLGTDPLDPDTDDGGIGDGVEVRQLKTDPLAPFDDRPIADRESLDNEENIFVVRPLCNSCPCLATVELGSQLLPGDSVFASILNDQTSEIFIRSEEVGY